MFALDLRGTNQSNIYSTPFPLIDVEFSVLSLFTWVPGFFQFALIPDSYWFLHTVEEKQKEKVLHLAWNIRLHFAHFGDHFGVALVSNTFFHLLSPTLSPSLTDERLCWMARVPSPFSAPFSKLACALWEGVRRQILDGRKLLLLWLSRFCLFSRLLWPARDHLEWRDSRRFRDKGTEWISEGRKELFREYLRRQSWQL